MRFSNIFKSASHCLLVERLRLNWMIEVFAAVCPWMSVCLLRPSFISGEASSCKRYTYRERVGYCHVDDTGAR